MPSVEGKETFMGMWDDDLWDDRDRDDFDDHMVVTITGCELVTQTKMGYLIRVPTSKGHREAWFPKNHSVFRESTSLDPHEFAYADWLTPDWNYTIY
jgi:hypothetical protein